MKILFIQDYLRCGGTERQTVSLCEQFARCGHMVALMTFRPGGRLAGSVKDTGVSTYSLQPFDTGLDFLAPGLFGKVARLRPDVVLCMGRVANSYAGFLRLRFKDTVIVASARTGKPLPLLNQWSFRRVDAVLANCEWWHDRLVSIGVPESKLEIVHSGLTTSWDGRRGVSSVRRRVREALGAGEKTVVFLDVAGFRRGKRHAWLIETFARVRPTLDWQLWLVGDGGEWRRCRGAAERSYVARNIKLLGHRADPYPFFRGADVAVSASVEDALPNFLIEAQSVGLPVIASDVRGVGETFSHGKSGYLVPAADGEGFLSRIEELCSDAVTRRSMGRLGESMARGRFSRRGQAQKMLRVLESLLSTKLNASPIGASTGD